MEQRATGINALEYKMAQQEKRGRGRARGEIMGGYKILRKRVAKLEQYTAERLREAEKLLLRFAEYNLTPAEEDKLYEDVLEHQRKYKINAA